MGTRVGVAPGWGVLALCNLLSSSEFPLDRGQTGGALWSPGVGGGERCLSKDQSQREKGAVTVELGLHGTFPGLNIKLCCLPGLGPGFGNVSVEAEHSSAGCTFPFTIHFCSKKNGI